MRMRGAIFDLDGTLLDSMHIWDTIGEEYLRSLGKIPEEGLNEKFKAMSIVRAAEYYRTRFGVAGSVEDIIKGVNGRIDHLYAHAVRAKPGVAGTLKRLERCGVRMCVATATDRYMAEAALKGNGLDRYFCGLLTCAEVGYGKDSPEIFEQARALLQTAKQNTVVFEDAPHAIETAKRAGFVVAGVCDRSAESRQDYIREISDYNLETFEDWREPAL